MNMACDQSQVVEIIVMVILVLVGLVRGPIQVARASKLCEEKSQEIALLTSLLDEQTEDMLWEEYPDFHQKDLADEELWPGDEHPRI